MGLLIIIFEINNYIHPQYKVVKRSMRLATFSNMSNLSVAANSLSLGSAPMRSLGGNTDLKAPSVYFTTTVGKKPTLADSYLNSSDDVSLLNFKLLYSDFFFFLYYLLHTLLLLLLFLNTHLYLLCMLHVHLQPVGCRAPGKLKQKD
jgi:hypothetical protein